MIVVAGEALVDLVVEPDGAVGATLGGAPFNTARAAARLGATVTFVGALSGDRFGTLLREQLVGDGVDVGHVVASDLPTTLAAAELDPGGAATYRFYVAGTSAPTLSAADIASVPDDPDVVFTGGLALVFEPLADAMVELVERSVDSTAVVVDVNCRPRVVTDREQYLRRIDRILARTDIVKVSDEDLAFLLPGVDTAAAAARVLDRGPAAVVVTAGAGTTRLVTGGGEREVRVAAPTAPVVDTIGAGDTFAAGLVTAWLARGGHRRRLREDGAGDHLAHAVVDAHQAAAVVVTRRGADPPWRSELPAGWAT